MPTLPDPRQLKQTAQSFGVDVQRYDRARPGYPAELIDRLADAGREIVDVGCGTGIAARQLRERGCAVLGVEPDERMAEFARIQGIDVEVATFEQWDAKGRTFDAVVAGQAWHWVDPAQGARKAAEVLKPGGLLGLFWHLFVPPEDIAAVFGEAFRRAVPDSPIKADRAPTRDAYRPVVENSLAGSDFDGLEEHFYEWQHHYTRDEYLDLLPTQGGLTRVSDEQRAAVLTAVGAAIDARGGQFTCDYTTVLFTAGKR
ncbi:bifunctional 2-polyprenyl-6-hydroxyphenol methylase/3-demethylubiquinol 3-O-methyltransferase UbiG [Amycolatopsis sp. FDAARGOS 1241]|uniref:class I SAM-dependent methyltransferase n=1 Tax=Amycolatopsis sp. FDAARGOS 1241 TaxID=2778070 RepID=UPI00194EEDCA|nr:class I SAM-dependent methyltransferase [Amycolatopsis sp. FDAARGOS 1241]QRP45238.1 class I SAM-dependent methyltransferase [Amycolatopsis sp. FDAARGOS 1241]